MPLLRDQDRAGLRREGSEGAKGRKGEGAKKRKERESALICGILICAICGKFFGVATSHRSILTAHRYWCEAGGLRHEQ
jgi:hypothetical protein